MRTLIKDETNASNHLATATEIMGTHNEKKEYEAVKIWLVGNECIANTVEKYRKLNDELHHLY